MSHTLTLTRTYPAPPDRVFSAWTDVDLLTTWFGCGPDMLWDVHVWNPVPGGELHVSLEFDHGPFEVRGRFVEVDRPNRLVYEWERGQIVTVTFRPIDESDAPDGGTEMTLEHAGLPDEAMKGIVTEGWTDGTHRLTDVVKSVTR